MILIDDAVRKRFMSFVTVTSEEGCWYWGGSLNNSGHGQFSLQGSVQLAHRVSLAIHEDKMPHGYEVEQACGCSFCVNPRHLRKIKKPSKRSSR